MFYLLDLLTGILECGWIAYGTVCGMPLWQILSFPLAYHIGNLFPFPFSVGKKAITFLSAVPACIGIIMLTGITYESCRFWLICTALASGSAVLQTVRSNRKNRSSRLLKRLFRVGGFLLAPSAAVIPKTLLILTSVIIIPAAVKYEGKPGICSIHGQKGFSAVMIFHQMHYFFYAHTVLAAVSLAFYENMGFSGIAAAAGLFCCTWITYMSVEPIVSRLTSRLTAVFWGGHISICIILAAMSFIRSLPLFTVLWIITGFGGGTVYTISALAKKYGAYNKNDMTVSENLGHTFGLLTAVAVSALSNEYTAPHIMLIFASVSALLAAFALYQIRRNQHESYGKSR